MARANRPPGRDGPQAVTQHPGDRHIESAAAERALAARVTAGGDGGGDPQ